MRCAAPSTPPPRAGGRPPCSTRCGTRSGLLAIGAARVPESRLAAPLLAAGTLVFCATLYLMALGAPRWLGAITPIGGSLMIAGWLVLAWRVARPRG